jgi:hypothetical protein
MELFPGTVSLQTQSDKHLQFTPSVTTIRSRLPINLYLYLNIKIK